MHYDKDTISLSTTFQEYHQAKEDILYAPTHVARKDFFTASGLKKFLETGQLYTFFSDYTTPLEKGEILQFLALCGNHRRPSSFQLSPDL